LNRNGWLTFIGIYSLLPHFILGQSKIQEEKEIDALLSSFDLPINERRAISELLKERDGTIQVMDYLRPRKNYSASEVEIELPFLLIEKDEFMPALHGGKSIGEIYLNIYDSLFVEISAIARSNNSFKEDKKAVFHNKAEVLLAELLIYGPTSQRFISLIIDIGEFGLNQHRRITDYQKFLAFVEGLLKGHHGTQFYIDANAKMAEIYFNKDIQTHFTRSFYNVYYSIMEDKAMQGISNIMLLRNLSYLFYKIPNSHNIGDIALRKTWPIITFHFPELFELVQLDQIYLANFSTAVLNYPNSYEESVKTLTKNFGDNSVLKCQATLLLAKLYFKHKNWSGLESLNRDLNAIETSDIHILRDRCDFFVNYYLATDKSEMALEVIDDFLMQIEKGNSVYRKEFSKWKIKLLGQTNDSSLEDLIEEEIYQLTYSFINNNEIYPDYLRRAFTKIQADEISDLAQALFKMDSVKTGDSNYCNKRAYYYLYDYINELKGAIANNIPVEKLIFDSKKNSHYDDYHEVQYAESQRFKIISEMNTSINSDLFNSLTYDLNLENEELRLLLNQVIDTEKKPIEIDSILKDFNGKTIFLNLFNISSKKVHSDDYLIFIHLKLPDFEQNFLLAQIIEIEKTDSNPYQTIWSNLSLLEKIEFDNVLICPDGKLFKHNLNQVKNSNGSFILENHSVRYISSPKNFVNQSSGKLENDDFILLGNPSFRNTINQINKQETDYKEGFNGLTEFEISRSGIKPLPYSEKELLEIEKVLVKNQLPSTLFLNDNANEETLKKINKPKVLHLATHGFFVDDFTLSEQKGHSILGFETGMYESQPLFRSGLLLASAENHLRSKSISRPVQNEGILTAYEVMDIDLENTELVVLSACETGLGEIVNAEGVYGLQRAFKIAGAQSILMSLSKVPDEATQVLMVKFYTYWIEKGLSKHESLRAAQMEMIKSEKFSDPINWSSFVLME
jgi:CHAT domain-containing protein